MQIPMDEIIAFHQKRTKCHIASLNYFAGLLGYHFPKHDYDKFVDPIQVGYAYYNYARYHGCKIPKQYLDAFDKAHAEHHSTQSHHREHYRDIREITHDTIIEMVCDWCSANFEQSNITHEDDFESVLDYFEQKIAQLNWTDTQRKTIIETIKFLETHADIQQLYKIWADVM